jgi:xanthine dehydrogenase molybdenum-binding subunit
MTYKLLGQDFTPPDVFAKVTGTAKYAEDFRAEGMVFCRMMTSPMPHARVRAIDVSAALALPGVLGVLLPSEVTAVQEPNPPILTDEPQFVPAVGSKGPNVTPLSGCHVLAVHAGWRTS